jgi:AAA-like domain
MRRFHSYGPVDAEEHFCAERRDLVEQCVERLVGNPDKGGHFFTIWAPRQTGKTWLMRRAIAEIRAQHGDRFVIGALSMQGLLDADEGDDAFFRCVPELFREGLRFEPAVPADWNGWRRIFARDQGSFDKPLILLIDEFDALPQPVIDRLVAGFRKIYLAREGYSLHGLALIGVRAVLGVDSPRGSPFNVQSALHVPNLTRDEVVDLFAQYQAESGQTVEPEVVEKLYAATRGQPGLVGWLGELLTEKYNPDPQAPITLTAWEEVHGLALHVEPNNTVMNLIQKARGPYRDEVQSLFSRSDVPFSFDKAWCSFLYLNGIIDYERVTDVQGGHLQVCRFSSPFIQLRLYNALTDDLFDERLPTTALDPRDRLTDVFAGAEIDAAALVERYKAYLGRLAAKGLDPWKEQPRRAFHLYAWLKDALGRRCVVSPEFPTGNGKVDLCLSTGDKRGIIEVKSFTSATALDDGKLQAAQYAAKLGLTGATLCVFVPVNDEAVLAELSGVEEIEGVKVTTAAIGWG